MKQTLLFFAALVLATTMQAQVLFSIPNATFNAGDTVRARFYVSNFNGIGAIQFAMKHDTAALRYLPTNPAVSPLEFTGAIPNMGNGSFSWYGKPVYNLTPGELRCAWFKATGATVADGTLCFTVVFKAKTSGNLASAFWLWANHPTLPPAAYKAIPITSVGLNIAYTEQGEITGTATPNHNYGLTAYPNPFTEQTTVSFSLPQEGALRVFDATGRQVFQTTATPGEGQVALCNFPAAGVYIVQITTQGGSAVRKIVRQ